MGKSLILRSSRGTVVFGRAGFVLHRFSSGAPALVGGIPGERTVVISGYILPEGDSPSRAARAEAIEQARALLCRLVGDAAGFTLLWGDRQIRLQAESAPEFSQEPPLNGEDAAYFTIRARSGERGSFVGEACRYSARGLTGGLVFPLAVTEETVFGRMSEAGNLRVINPGDMEAGFVATLTVESGEVSGVRLSLGEAYIEVVHALAEGESVEIDTRPGQKDVRIGGESVFGDTSRESTFFALPPGESTLCWNSEGGVCTLSVALVPEFM